MPLEIRDKDFRVAATCSSVAIALLLLLPPIIDLPAQTNPLHFTHLTVDDGLSQNLVYSILQDRKGFLWFGTKDGLNRYDGYRFTVFRHDPFDSTSISGHEVKVLCEDRAGNLWIGTTGLNRFDPRTETFSRYLHDAAKPNSLSHNDVHAIAEDHTGVLWVGTTNGLNRLAPDRAGFFTHYFHDPNNQQSLSHAQITTLLVDRSGTLWIGIPQGLNALPPGSTSGFIRYHLKDDFVSSLYEDRHGILWAGTASGLFRFDPRGAGTQTFQHYPLLSAPQLLRWERSITAIQERPDGKFWVGTYAGLVVFDPQTGTSHSIRHDSRDPRSLNFDVILSIYQDRGGIFWFGSAGKGLNKLNPHAKAFQHYGGKVKPQDDQEAFSIHALLEDQAGRLWLNANDRLYQLDRATGQWRRFESAMAPVGAMLEDRQGILWFATGNGLWEFDPRTQRLTRHQHIPGDQGSLPSSSIWHVIEGKDGNLWVVTAGGMLSRLDRITGRWTHFKIPDAEKVSVSRLHQDSRGVFWLGSDAGLIRFHPRDSSARYYRNDPRNPSSLSYDHV